MTPREKIEEHINDTHFGSDPEYCDIDIIMKIIQDGIDEVQQDYHNELSNWGKSQPMTDMWPHEMKTLERVRQKFGIKENKK